jgi:polyferredoxin
MTQQEIENELKSLRAQEQARRDNWRSIRRGVAVCAIVFLLGGVAFLAFAITSSNTRIEPFQTAIMFIMLSLNMSLLGAALR